MHSFLLDLRLSIRRLLGRPAGTLVAIVTLSAGIGGVSTMYLLFKAGTDDLPRVPGVERIGRVFISDPIQRDGRIPPAPAEQRAWLESPPRGVLLAVATDAEILIDPGAQSVRAQRVSPAFFDVAGVQPEIGRTFARGEHGVIASRRLWDLLPPASRRLGASLTVDGEERALIGVMPASFWMPRRGVDAWLPRAQADDVAGVQVLARLADDVTAEQAAAALTPVVQHLRGRRHAAQVRLLASDAAVRRRTGVVMLVGPAFFVLLAVCANVSALLLGDVRRRRQELAVRAALGASRWRLAREVFSDALVIAGLGGVVSLAAAYWSVRGLRAAMASVSPEFAAMMPAFAAVSPVALGAALAAVLGVGYAPALFASRVRIVADLAGTSPPLFRKGRYGSADLLLVLQIAMATGLVLWTAVFAGIFERVRAIPAHIPADRVWGIEIAARPGLSVLPPDLPGMLLGHAAAAPGIDAAGVNESGGARRLWSATDAAGWTTTCSASLQRVSGEFFAAYGFPLRGREPLAGEAVLNDLAVLRCANAATLRDASAPSESLRVVGSVDDRMMGAGLPGPSGPAEVYALLTRPSGRDLALMVRSRSASPADARALREDLVRSFPGVIFGEPRSFAAEHERQAGGGLLIVKLLGVLAALALLFGIVGLHAAIAQALATRTREIGVRMALGAAPRNVVGVTVGHHAAPAALGITLGAAVAVGGLFTLGTDDAAMIREMALLTARSPAAWAALLGLLLASTLASAALPVLRALRLDPAAVLRQE